MILQEVDVLAALGYDTAYCGMAEGADLLCCEALLYRNALQPQWNRMHVHCVIPIADPAKTWSEAQKLRYYRYLHAADEVTEIAPHCHRGCYHKRNRFLVDQADVLLAIYDGQSKGRTSCTIDYARKQGKKVIIINPFTLERTMIP